MSPLDLFRVEITAADRALAEAKKALDIATDRWVTRKITHAQWFEVATAYGQALVRRDDLARSLTAPRRGPADEVTQ